MNTIFCSKRAVCRKLGKRIYVPLSLLFFLLSVLISSCTTTAFLSHNSAGGVKETTCKDLALPPLEWKEITPYSWQTEFYLKEQKTKCCLIKIDLSFKDLEIITVAGEKPLSIVKASKNHALDIAFNTTPFYKDKKTGHLIPAGIVKLNDGNFCGDFNSKYSALAFYKAIPPQTGFTARIFTSQTENPSLISESYTACGGFFTIIDNSKIPDYKNIRDARTAAGLAADGQTLYILAVSGGPFSTSRGLSYNQCASLLLNFNVTDALEFDGGSSTSIAVNKKAVLSYPTRKIPVIMGFTSPKFNQIDR